MADAVPLDPGAYGGTYKLIGGAMALDFANLVSYRNTDREHDWLEPASNIHLWAEAAGINVPTDSNVAELREFRELLARTFLAIAEGLSPESADIEKIGSATIDAWTHRRLSYVLGSAEAIWTDQAPSLMRVIALNASDLLTSAGSLQRLAACEECWWLFLDTTRNRSRRWCDPADCGNRARQRRHYQRQRES